MLMTQEMGGQNEYHMRKVQWGSSYRRPIGCAHNPVPSPISRLEPRNHGLVALAGEHQM